MRIVESFDVEPAFEILLPATQRLPFVFNSPHSGSAYPAAFLAQSRLDSHRIRLSEDAHVDALFLPVVEAGAPLMRALFPRAYVDVNREPYELDPRMFAGRLPAEANIRSLRVAGGLGTVPRVVTERDEIYRGPIPVDDALGRIESLYKPYHAALRRLIARTHVHFGAVALIDCHSMPSMLRGQDGRGKADVVVGDRHGTSASRMLVDHVVDALAALGYRVAINRPYAGGFITEHYGRPSRGLHAVQIEISRALYMDEATLERTAGFDGLRDDLARFAASLFALSPTDLGLLPGRLAAE